MSKQMEIKAGVPQWSVLSPTGFAIDMNDLPLNNDSVSQPWATVCRRLGKAFCFYQLRGGGGDISPYPQEKNAHISLDPIQSSELELWKLISTLVGVYKSLIRTPFDFSAYMSLLLKDEKLFNALESIQCSALRIIYGYKWDDKITNIELRKKNNLTTIK